MPAIEASSPLNDTEQERRNRLKRTKLRAYEKVVKFSEKLKNGESTALIVLQYDYRCNFRCVHCCIKGFQDRPRERTFDIAALRDFAAQADEAGLAQFYISGGEPLLNKNFDEIVEAIDPQRFHISIDTNGWFIDEERAKHLKDIGVDKLTISLDALSAEEHDAFRRMPGSHARVLAAVDAAQKVGLLVNFATVVTKQRVRSDELIRYLEFAKSKGVGTFVSYAKPAGSWQGRFDLLVDRSDFAYMKELEKKYDVFSHLTAGYGLDVGCIAVKRIIVVTPYGDIMPCPFMYTSLGNVFEEPFRDILARGMNIKYFGQHVDTCLMAEDREFIEKYGTKMEKYPLPVPYREVFEEEDFL